MTPRRRRKIPVFFPRRFSSGDLSIQFGGSGFVKRVRVVRYTRRNDGPTTSDPGPVWLGRGRSETRDLANCNNLVVAGASAIYGARDGVIADLVAGAYENKDRGRIDVFGFRVRAARGRADVRVFFFFTVHPTKKQSVENEQSEEDLKEPKTKMNKNISNTISSWMKWKKKKSSKNK